MLGIQCSSVIAIATAPFYQRVVRNLTPSPVCMSILDSFSVQPFLHFQLGDPGPPPLPPQPPLRRLATLYVLVFDFAEHEHVMTDQFVAAMR